MNTRDKCLVFRNPGKRSGTDSKKDFVLSSRDGENVKAKHEPIHERGVIAPDRKNFFEAMEKTF